MTDIDTVLQQLGLELPPPPAKGGIYAPARQFGGNLVSISGCGPQINKPVAGRVGSTFTKEEAARLACDAMLNVLSVLQAEIGDLKRVKQVVKIVVFVASEPHFFDQPFVANGASELLVTLFGETIGAPTRSAIGVFVLPGNIPVEIEAIFEITMEEEIRG